MKKILFIIAIIVIFGGFATGCNLIKDDNEQEKTLTSSNKTTNNEKVVDEKAWKDITKLKIPEGEKSDYPTNAKDWIASENLIFNEEPVQDSKLIQAGFDKYYHYYLEAITIPSDLAIIKVKGISIEKDFANIEQLSSIIQEEHDKRTEHIDPNRSDKREANAEWKAPSERLVKASDFLKQLFYDLDIAINKDGKGELYGVAHQVDGQNVDELEVFIQDEE
ncbi:hypothetical protein [Bacillus marasmi]|uniref:hypothetical protein n=1 Tax=Bacillus marasmi TaxID=1926279 RepID=UPI0011CA60A5|nr:hypothetical protein [Bacillus marasmi]